MNVSRISRTVKAFALEHRLSTSLIRSYSNGQSLSDLDKPKHMDLGEDFYRRLMDAERLKSRREENRNLYPPKEVLKQMLPDMGVQFDIYWNGVYGELPTLPVDPDLLEKKFLEEADEDCVIWLFGRAGSKTTYGSNRNDFEKWRLVPKMLCGKEKSDLSTSFVLGQTKIKWNYPIGVAPVGVQGRVSYPDVQGDLLSARASASVGIPFIVSSVSSTPLELIAKEIKETNADAPAPWFQLYNSNVSEISKSILSRAKKSGYGAVVITLDTVKYGYRTEELESAYFPQADVRLNWSQQIYDPVFNHILKGKFNCVACEEFSEDGKYPVDKMKANMLILATVGVGLGDSWEKRPESTRENDSLEFLLEFVQKTLAMPLIVKGILHPDDALKACEMGVDGIYVSNHGGRQVDGSISTIEALPSIMNVVRKYAADNGKEEIPVFLDSGVRYGQHVVKALALGASAVFAGRLPIMGANLNGTEGAKHVLLNMIGDTDCTMMNIGCPSVKDLQNTKSPIIVRSPDCNPPPFC